MKIKIRNHNISLSDKAMASKKKDEFVKEVMTIFENDPSAAEIKMAVGDAYDKAAKARTASTAPAETAKEK